MLFFIALVYENHFSLVSTGLGSKRRRRTNLEEHVVGCHGELAGVDHQAFNEQGEEAVTQHDLRFPPDQDIRRSWVSQLTSVLARPLFRKYLDINVEKFHNCNFFYFKGMLKSY